MQTRVKDFIDVLTGFKEDSDIDFSYENGSLVIHNWQNLVAEAGGVSLGECNWANDPRIEQFCHETNELIVKCGGDLINTNIIS